METIERVGLRGGHPTAWKFRHWTAPEERSGLRRLQWASLQEDFGKRGPLENDLIIPKLFEDQPFQLNNLTDQGEADIASVYFRNQALRTALYLRGYNDTLIEAETLSTAQNEVTGTGYAALTYTRNTDWSGSGSAAVGATKTWTAGGTWSAMTQVMLATVASGTSGSTIAYVALSATRTLASGETLDVTPTVTFS